MNNVDGLKKALIGILDSIGPYEAEPKKESIHIVRDRAFVGIHPKKSYLGVNIVLGRLKASPVASRVDQVSANRFHHYFKITDRQQLSKPFARLLKEAYDLAQPKR